jgi:superfamily II DNA or RNA helicase
MAVISLSARKAYLARARQDYREYKKLTKEQLEERMLKLPVKPPIWYKLTHLQKVCFIIGAETQRFCYFNDLGTGKSLLAIALIRYFRRLQILKHVLVLVPNRINKNEWRYELKKHCPNSSSLILKGDTEGKWGDLDNSNDLFVFETYSGLTRMVSDNKNGKLVPNAAKVNKLAQHFQGFVCDESVGVGNHNTIPFRICRKMAKTSQVVFTMTGTPFNRDPTLMWAQMFLVDGGYTLGETLGLFRSIYCKEEENYWSGYPTYKFDTTKETLLNDIISNKSISYPADEGSLPECVSIQKYVSLPEDAGVYYNKFKQELIAAKGNYHETKNAFLRLRQISSGFVGYQDDETGERSKFEFPDNPKLDLLVSMLKTVQEDHKSIVFFEFTFSGEKILEALKKEKIDSVLLYGNTKDVDKARNEFMTKPKKRVLILQNRFGIGMNVQIAKYLCFYESPVSAILRKQCRGRVVRQHSLYKTVFEYDLLVEGTMDSKILEFHKEGCDLFDAIIRGECNIS